MPFLQKETTKIHYVKEPIMNKKNAKTIILIHTNIMDLTIYDKMIPFLNDEFNVVRYDLRGFGLSDLGHEELSLDLYVDDLKFLIHSLRLKSVHLVGFGFGSLIALKFSILHKKLVDKLILMTMACFPEDTYESVKAHRRKVSRNGTKIPIDTLIEKVTSLKPDDPEYAQLYHMINQVPPSTYKKIMDLTLYTNPIPLLKKTTKDTLILGAEREIIFPQNLLITITSYLDNIHYTVVPNSASFLMIDQPFFTAQLLKEFLKKEKKHLYSEDVVANEIYEHVRMYAENVYTLGTTTKRAVNEIRVDFLYSFQVEINGKHKVKGWNQRYAKQILLYLLFHQSTTREQICNHLWPDVPLNMSKQNLRVYLYHLNRILNDASLSHQPILTFDREHVYLNGKVTSDALRFISEIQQALNTEEDELKYVRVNKVLDKISSSSYLLVIFDDWFLEIRDKVEQDLLNLSVWIARWLLKKKEWQAAKYQLQKFMHIFDDHEEVHAVLFELYSQMPKHKLDDWIIEKVEKISFT